jgi:hypothetical protein
MGNDFFLILTPRSFFIHPPSLLSSLFLSHTLHFFVLSSLRSPFLPFIYPFLTFIAFPSFSPHFTPVLSTSQSCWPFSFFLATAPLFLVHMSHYITSHSLKPIIWAYNISFSRNLKKSTLNRNTPTLRKAQICNASQHTQLVQLKQHMAKCSYLNIHFLHT